MKMLNMRETQSNIIYEKIKNYEFVPVNVICRKISDQINPEDAIHQKHWHRSIEIIYTANSTSYIGVNGKHIVLPPEHVFIINSYDIHEILEEEFTEPFNGYTFQIEYGFIKSRHPEMEHVHLYADEKAAGLLKPLLIEIADLWLGGRQKNQKILLYLCDALVEMLYTYAVQNTVESKQIHDELFTKILNYLDKNYDTDINFTQTAEHFHISYTFMCRKFRTYLNMTPGQYINKQRIQRSLNDLCNEKSNIAEVSYQYDFPNTGSYIREFKRLKGVTPSEYRKMMSE